MFKSAVAFGLLCLGTSVQVHSSSIDEAPPNPKPNIIYILADDLGYGDLSCYGQTKFKTPHIDELASNGMKFLRHYSGSTVCAPSRSTLLTGLHTGHTPIRGNKEIQPEGQEPMPAETVTIAELLKKEGYHTAAVGKWGLGFIESEGDPNNQGFDYFFGYNCQRYAHRYYPAYLWENNQKYPLEGNDWTQTETYAPDVIHEKAIDYIKENKDDSFFLYYAAIMPHAELIVPEDSLLDRFTGRFEETPFEGKAYNHENGAAYGPDIFIPGYAPCEKPKATFASMIYRLDSYVGEINSILDSLGIRENTLIIFTSDNGPHQEGGADPDFFDSNGPYRGYKRDLYEGGIHVPMIVQWPAKVKSGTSTNHISAFWDVFPTLAEIAGMESEPVSDGISMVPTLMGRSGEQEAHEYLYWEFHERGGRQAVLQGNWKYVKYQVFNKEKTKAMLFDLSNDIAEQNNVAGRHPDLVAHFESILQKEHTESDVFPFFSN